MSIKLASPCGNFPAGATVSQLFEPETGSCNVPLIENDFLPFEAQKILAIPSYMTRQQDITIWPRCKTGSYSVKTGYQLLNELDDRERASSSDNVEVKTFWSRIWKLDVPNKVKMFMWRACSEALPTKMNLRKRKILENSLCSQCSKGEEDTIHTLWDCDDLHCIWDRGYNWIQRDFHTLPLSPT